MTSWVKFDVTYTEYGTMCDDLVDSLKEEPIRSVYGVFRGGLPLAVHLSHTLNIKMIKTLDELGVDDFPLLVVDDIVDSGKTFLAIKKELKEIFDFIDSDLIFASLFVKPWAKFEVDYFIKRTEDWPVFPWETMSEETNREKPDEFSGTKKILKQRRDWT